MDDIIVIGSRVAGVLLVMVLGGLARYLGWLTAAADKSLANFTSFVLLPSLLYSRIMGNPNFDSPTEIWLPILVGFCCTSFGFLLGLATASGLRGRVGLESVPSQRSFALCVGIANYSYIPLPLAEFFFPESVVTLMIHTVGVELALWSVGLWVLTRGSQVQWWRLLFSPPLVALAVSIGIKQMGLHGYVPGAVQQATQSLGSCAIPMGLVLGGAIIFDYLPKANWKENRVATMVAILIRVLILPVVFLSAAYFLPFSKELKAVVLLQAAMPAAIYPIVMTRMFDSDMGTAIRTSVGTNLVAMATIPIWVLVGRSILSI